MMFSNRSKMSSLNEEPELFPTEDSSPQNGRIQLKDTSANCQINSSSFSDRTSEHHINSSSMASCKISETPLTSTYLDGKG